MTDTMLAVVTHDPREYRVEEVPVPAPGPGERIIEVGAIDICASDMKYWLGGLVFDTNEINIHGSHLGPGGYAPSIDALVSGTDDVKPLLAEAHSLTEFELAMQRVVSGDVLKTIILPV